MNDGTNVDEAQIERIVHEVTRRLLALNQPADGHRSPEPAPPVAAAGANGHAARAARTLRVADRVVTMARLAGRLEGITLLQVMSNAILTPLVVDELREQGIRLERQPARSTDAATPADNATLWLVAEDDEARRVAAVLDAAADKWRQLPADGDATGQINAMPPQTCALVLTADWANAVCRLNRRPEIRAAVAWSAATVEQACRQMDPNVLVIDSARLSEAPLHDAIRRYVQHVRQAASHTRQACRPTRSTTDSAK